MYVYFRNVDNTTCGIFLAVLNSAFHNTLRNIFGFEHIYLTLGNPTVWQMKYLGMIICQVIVSNSGVL